MDSAAIFATSNVFCSTNQFICRNLFTPKPTHFLLLAPKPKLSKKKNSTSTTTTYTALSETSTAISDPATVDITWQIVVGTLAGITPFTVAGIEFSKRIVKQRKCGVCSGSGLVPTADKNYVKCPACGGWLPWLSWRRFFLG